MKQYIVRNHHIFKSHGGGIPLNIDSYDYRAICLFCALILYAFLGSPTPDIIGYKEIIIGAALALSIGVGRAYEAAARPAQRRFWKSAGQIFLIYGLSVPLLNAAILGHGVREIMRDVLPFLFLFLPLFLLPLIRARPYYFRSSVVAVLIIGFVFSFRSLIMRDEVLCSVWCSEELLYLENMPSVLFAALFAIGFGLQSLMRGTNMRNMVIFGVLISLSLLPIAAMALTLQRASLGAVALYIALIIGYFLFKSPYRAFGVLGGGAIALMLINISFAGIFDGLWDKSEKVGLNMRPQEFMAVWEVVSSNPITFIFGVGWGGSFDNPAVGGLNVNFTHNFFSSMFLKTGLLGLLCSIAYIAGLLERLARVVLINPVLGLALLAPILIDLSLYASFKSLDFGLMLLMISGALVYFRQSESIK